MTAIFFVFKSDLRVRNTPKALPDRWFRSMMRAAGTFREGQVGQVLRPSGLHRNPDMLGSLLDFGEEKEVVHHHQSH